MLPVKGKEWTPEELDDKTLYHMPSIKSVRLMDRGEICVIAENARNTMPDGKSFYGFSGIEDDLGRTYFRVYSSLHIPSDTSTQVFVSENYPFDEQRPAYVTLTCRGYYLISKPREMPVTGWIKVGSIRVDTLQRGKGWPETLSHFHPRINLAREFLLNSRDLERADRILETIKGDPAESKEAFLSCSLQMELLVRRKEYTRAAELARNVAPILLKDYGTWSPKYHSRKCGLTDFIHCLAAFAGAGQIKEAEKLLLEIEKTPVPNPPDKFGKEQRDKYIKKMSSDFDINLSHVAYQVLGYAGITVEQLGEILGSDVLADPRLRDLRGNFQMIKKQQERKKQ